MKLPKTIIYTNINDVKAFNLEKFKDSLSKYGEINENVLEKQLDEFSKYSPLHVSCLVEIGINSFKNDEDAAKYYEDHQEFLHLEAFERLRRITGYLVGTLDRWNDGKKAEEKARVKHSVDGVYTKKEKSIREFLKSVQEKAFGKC